MSNRKDVRFFILEDGFVVSRYMNHVAWPVLQFAKMLPENNFLPTYQLEKLEADFTTLKELYTNGKGTKKIPLTIKNLHREFWGLKPTSSSKYSF